VTNPCHYNRNATSHSYVKAQGVFNLSTWRIDRHSLLNTAELRLAAAAWKRPILQCRQDGLNAEEDCVEGACCQAHHLPVHSSLLNSSDRAEFLTLCGPNVTCVQVGFTTYCILQRRPQNHHSFTVQVTVIQSLCKVINKCVRAVFALNKACISCGHHF